MHINLTFVSPYVFFLSAFEGLALSSSSLAYFVRRHDSALGLGSFRYTCIFLSKSDVYKHFCVLQTYVDFSNIVFGCIWGSGTIKFESGVFLCAGMNLFEVGGALESSFKATIRMHIIEHIWNFYNKIRICLLIFWYCLNICIFIWHSLVHMFSFWVHLRVWHYQALVML